MTMKLRFIAIILAAALGVLGVAQTGASASQSMFQSTTVVPTGKPVVRVNGTVLTDRDLLREMMTIFPYASQHGGKFPQSMEADIRRGALDMIEFDELVFQEAVRRNFKISSARLDQSIQAFRDQFNSSEEFHAYLNSECNGSTS